MLGRLGLSPSAASPISNRTHTIFIIVYMKVRWLHHHLYMVVGIEYQYEVSQKLKYGVRREVLFYPTLKALG